MTRWRYIVERLRRVWTDERGFITTSAILGIVLGSAGAQVASNVYGSKKAAGENRRATEAQERIDRQALEAQERAEAADRRQREWEMRMQIDQNQRQWDAYTQAMTPYWQTGHEAFGKLSGLLGLAQPAPLEVPSGGGGAGPPPSAGAFGSGARGLSRPVAGAPPLARTAPRVGRGREYAANVMQMPAPRTSNPLADLRSLTDLYALAGRGGAPGGVGKRVPVR